MQFYNYTPKYIGYMHNSVKTSVLSYSLSKRGICHMWSFKTNGIQYLSSASLCILLLQTQLKMQDT